MTTRRDFLIRTSAAAAGAFMLPHLNKSATAKRSRELGRIGIQLYTFRDAMAADAVGTLAVIAQLGFKEIETASSSLGHYYGLTPAQMKKTCDDLGMVLRSGHVNLDDQFDKTMDEAVEAGQEYLICSSMPSQGQTVDNYRSVADAFNRAGEECRSRGLKFGYHNHDYEFESDGDQVLYDVLVENTRPDLVHMELDLGWVVASGYDPLDYFGRYPGRFPLWHLKDMILAERKSTEFGKGNLDIPAMLRNREASGVKVIFVEQEEYAVGPAEAMRANMDYLIGLGE